jgi:hypothetical protein
MEKENSNIVDAILVDDRQSLHPMQKEETDPELEVIKAGDELMDALDNAFAEFDDEHFDFDIDIDSSAVVVSEAAGSITMEQDSNHPIGKQRNVVEVEMQSDQAKFMCCESDAANDNSSSVNSSVMESMQETEGSNSRVSDESNTEEELEQELEKRVSEWIANADSNETLGSLEEKKDSHASPLLQTPIAASLLPTPVPVSSVKAVPNFVSPLAMNEQIFEKCKDESVGENALILSGYKAVSEHVDIAQETEEDQGHCSSSKEAFDHSAVDEIKELSKEEEKAPVLLDNDDNIENESSSSSNQGEEWDFDDVDSLPSSGDTSEVVDSFDEIQSIENCTTSDAMNVKTIQSRGKSNQMSDSPINRTTPRSKDQNDSKIIPSPNDVASMNSMPFFEAQKEAASNAGNVLNLSMEVQNLKEQIRKEKEINAMTTRDLEVEKEGKLQVEEELKKQRTEYAETQHTYCDDIQELMADCQHAKVKIQAAEHDAQEALELAHEAAESRTEMEVFLQYALDELEGLRDGVAGRGHVIGKQLPIIAEDDAAESDNLSHNGVDGDELMHSPKRSSPRSLDRRRAGISAGRTLLRQALDQDDASFASTLDDSVGSSTTDNSYFITLTRKSAEKRQRLVNRLKRSKNEDMPSMKNVVVFSSSDREGLDLKYTNAVSKGMKAIASVIRKSGRSLGLGGRWFKRSNRMTKSNGEEELDMERMTNSYCKSVETLISKQNDELKELKAFCDYLEDKVYEA